MLRKIKHGRVKPTYKREAQWPWSSFLIQPFLKNLQWEKQNTSFAWASLSCTNCLNLFSFSYPRNKCLAHYGCWKICPLISWLTSICPLESATYRTHFSWFSISLIQNKWKLGGKWHLGDHFPSASPKNNTWSTQSYKSLLQNNSKHPQVRNRQQGCPGGPVR